MHRQLILGTQINLCDITTATPLADEELEELLDDSWLLLEELPEVDDDNSDDCERSAPLASSAGPPAWLYSIAEFKC